MHTNKLGLKGESAAQRLMRRKGYKILEKNYTCFVGEADIICLKGNELVFVEVKSRSSDRFIHPADAVGNEKQRKYVAIAKYYVLTNKLFDRCVRFDIVEYTNGALNHIENAFFGK